LLRNQIAFKRLPFILFCDHSSAVPRRFKLLKHVEECDDVDAALVVISFNVAADMSVD